MDFQKFKILTVDALLGALVLNFIKIGQTVADGDLTVFKMAAVRHLGFVKFEIFNGWSS